MNKDGWIARELLDSLRRFHEQRLPVEDTARQIYDFVTKNGGGSHSILYKLVYRAYGTAEELLGKWDPDFGENDASEGFERLYALLVSLLNNECFNRGIETPSTSYPLTYALVGNLRVLSPGDSPSGFVVAEKFDELKDLLGANTVQMDPRVEQGYIAKKHVRRYWEAHAFIIRNGVKQPIIAEDEHCYYAGNLNSADPCIEVVCKAPEILRFFKEKDLDF